VKVCPATVIVPLRAPPVFGSTVNCKVAGPAPLTADVMWIHGTLGAFAFQPHVPVAFTLNDPDPPPDGTDWLVGEIEIVHPLAWMTVNGWPAIVIVP
jgi:hypothetical protein